jgi:protein FAM50
MTDIKRVGDAGVHTVEGNVAGARAAKMTKQREQQRQEYELAKNKIKEDNALKRIDQKFSSASESLENEFRRKTVGLVSADDFRKARAQIDEQKASATLNEALLQNKILEAKKIEKDLKRKKVASSLSFDGGSDNSDAAGDIPVIQKKKLKNPHVDTSFLPDAERDKEILQKREALKEEWLKQQEVAKDEVGNLIGVVHSKRHFYEVQLPPSCRGLIRCDSGLMLSDA